MEDPSEEWENEEYSSKVNGGKVSWILDKGLRLGTKILITGAVISSTPLVLPPLLVISAIAFAVSVPSGLFLASYACSEKLMSKLLPGPIFSPPLVEDEEMEEEGVGFGGDFGMGKEEEEQMEETKGGVEMRIEFVENENEENGQGKDKEGYEGDDKSGKFFEEMEIPFEARSVFFPVRERESVNDDIEEEELMGETRGLMIERIMEVGKVEDSKQNEEEMQGGAEEGDQKIVRIVEQMEIPFEDKNVYITREMEGKVEEWREEESPNVREKMENKDATRKEVESIGERGGILEGKGKDEKRGGILEGKGKDEKRRGKERKGKGKERMKIRTQPGKKGNHADNIVQDENRIVEINQPNINVVSVSEVMKPVEEMRGEGKDVVIEEVKPPIVISSVHETRKDSPCFVGSEGTKSIDLTVSAAVHESRHSGIASDQKDILIPSNEVLYNEEKIWEQIGAMRSIVGYRAVPQKTCIEEVKALYIFTGVEPPASFKDTSDLAEVGNKLQFLMSIVGVK